MDESRPPVSSWLAFTLAFEANARHVTYLRDNQLTPDAIAELICQHLQLSAADAAKSALAEALRLKLPATDLYRLRSPEVARKVDEALRWEQRDANHYLLSIDDPLYPALLRDTVDAPPLLYAKGHLSALRRPALAIVGSRKASHQAISHTRHMAQELVTRGFAIVSGLALGIDAAAHEGALAARGVTIAVAATEPESVYPRRHRALAGRIIESGGLVLTEYPLGVPTLKWYFPRRNRIISGLCSGVLVTEAALPSGTLTTATHAMNQGREVLAVPGSINNSQARGCHALIKQGAALIESPSDVMDALGYSVCSRLEEFAVNQPKKQSNPSIDSHIKGKTAQAPLDLEMADTLCHSILEQLSVQPATVDDLLQYVSSQSGSSVAELNAAIGILEINGQIKASAGGQYSLCQTR